MKRLIVVGALVLGMGCGGDAQQQEPSVQEQIASYDADASKADSQKPKQTLLDLCNRALDCLISYSAGDNRCGFNEADWRTIGNWVGNNCRTVWYD